MKKVFLFLLVLIGFGISAIAQDVIITKDGTKINSSVIEVNENDIRYKIFDNLSGPTYFLKKSEIASILYENGHVDVFNMSTSTPPQIGYYPYRYYTQNDLKNAKDLRNAGVTLFSTGMAFTFPIGLTLLFVPSYTYYERWVPDYYGYGGGYYITERVRNYAQTQAGLAFICMGPPITVAGIVMWAVGQYRMDMIRRINPNGFSLFENEKVQLNLAAGGNYMGLKLNF